MADKKPEEYYTRPATMSKGQAFSKFLYNGDTHEVLGRTAKSWLQITVFYIILYAFLAGFFAALLTIFYQTLDMNQPKWTMDSSLIGNSPGMGYRPTHADPDVALISFKPSDPTYWDNRVDEFLKPYYMSSANSNDYNDCNYGTESADPVQPCKFMIDLNKCSQNNYGFSVNKPCIFLKPNKIFGWTPVTYTKEEIQEEKDMPENLKMAILKLPAEVIEKNIWVSCVESEHNVTLTYDTHPGFPSYYFPYANQKGYLSPFVAMQIEELPVGVAVKISCRLWAKNIVVDRQRRLGMTNLEVMSNA